MVDGAAALVGPIRDLHNAGMWSPQRRANLLDGGAPFYACYRTSDDGFMAVGALEPQFYSLLVSGLGSSRTPSLRAHARSGRRSSTGRMRVSHRCCRWMRSATTRITLPDKPWYRWILDHARILRPGSPARHPTDTLER
jgi:crotonobetainyl-CoA:carnitine CoA-transferase CaiB-like acyl-CoA transferase